MATTKNIKDDTITSIAKPKGKYNYGLGKRKCSLAKVRLYKGTGTIIINDKPINEYLKVKTYTELIKSPFKITGTDKKFDTYVITSGGGKSSQACAIRHGIAKALVDSDPLSKPTLKKAGMLTRDSRIKERKKFGLKRARKGPQFSKR